MINIKVKRSLTYPQLIEYVWQGNLKNNLEIFTSNDELNEDKVSVTFSDDMDVTTNYVISIDKRFGVEVEEELTRKTIIPKMVILENNQFKRATNLSIADIQDIEKKKAIYSLNNDMTMTLICKNGIVIH